MHLRGLAPGQHNSEETSQRSQAVVDPVLDLTDPGNEPQPPRAQSDIFDHCFTWRCHMVNAFVP